MEIYLTIRAQRGWVGSKLYWSKEVIYQVVTQICRNKGRKPEMVNKMINTTNYECMLALLFSALIKII